MDRTPTTPATPTRATRTWSTCSCPPGASQAQILDWRAGAPVPRYAAVRGARLSGAAAQARRGSSAHPRRTGEGLDEARVCCSSRCSGVRSPRRRRPPAVRRRARRGSGTGCSRLLGNGGYDVQHYDVDLTYGNRFTDPVDGTVNILARATQALSRFNLDFAGRASAAVAVNGAPAQFRRDGAGARDHAAKRAIDNGALFIVTVSHFVAVPTVPGDDPSPRRSSSTRRARRPRRSPTSRATSCRPTTTRATRRASTSASTCPRG